MANMTWRELEDFIRTMDYTKIEDPVVIYNMSTEEKIYCDIVEIKKEDGSWEPFIGTNISEDLNV